MNAASAPSERRLIGVALRCAAATSFAMMGATLKIASQRGANLDELIFYRSIGAVPLVTFWALVSGGRQAILVKRPWAHLTRSATGLVAMVLTFGALTLLPLAQATTLTYSAALAATLLSALFLGEQVGWRRWAAVIIGFVGVVIVANPFGHRPPVLGLVVGMSASLMQAVVMVTLRQVSGKETTTSIVFWYTLATSTAAACLMPVYGHWHDPVTMAVLLGAGLIGGIGQLTVTASLRFAPVSVVAPFDYLQILWAMLIGWVLLANPPAATTLIGAALIIASGVYTAYREARHGRTPLEGFAPPEG